MTEGGEMKRTHSADMIHTQNKAYRKKTKRAQKSTSCITLGSKTVTVPLWN